MRILRFPAIVLGTLLSIGAYAQQAPADNPHGEHEAGAASSTHEQQKQDAKRHSDRQGREPADGHSNTLDGDGTPEGQQGDSTDPTNPGGSGGDGRTDPGILN